MVDLAEARAHAHQYRCELGRLISTAPMLIEALADENEKLRAKLIEAELAVRSWHIKALELRDLSITGRCHEIEKVYFNAAMSLPFYGGGNDPTPSQRRALE